MVRATGTPENAMSTFKFRRVVPLWLTWVTRGQPCLLRDVSASREKDLIERVLIDHGQLWESKVSFQLGL